MNRDFDAREQKDAPGCIGLLIESLWQRTGAWLLLIGSLLCGAAVWMTGN